MADQVNHAAPQNYRSYMQPREVKVVGSTVMLSNDATNMDIKAHFHELPRFYGMPNKDVMKFFKEYEGLVGLIPLTATEVTDEDITKKVFPICLQDLAKNS